MANKTKEQKEIERRAALTQEERDAEDALAIKKKEEEGKKKEEETVEVSKKHLNDLLERLDRQARDIDILYKASDKSRMAKALSEGGEVLIKQVKVWTWDDTGRIIIATELVSNKSEVVMGKWVEDQNVVVIFEDGKSETVPYLQFVRRTINKIPAEIVGTTKKTENGKESVIYKLQFPNGKVLEINAAFVN